MPINLNYARHALPPNFANDRSQEEEKGAEGERRKKIAGEREREKKARLEKYPAIYAFNYAAAILRRINIACAS